MDSWAFQVVRGAAHGRDSGTIIMLVTIVMTLAVLSLYKLGLFLFRLPYISSRQHPSELKQHLKNSGILAGVYITLLVMFFIFFMSLGMALRMILLLWLIFALSEQLIEFRHYHRVIKHRDNLLGSPGGRKATVISSRLEQLTTPQR